MNAPGEIARTLVIATTLVASVCHCKGPPEPERHAAPASSAPAVWEPVDDGFTGCAGA